MIIRPGPRSGGVGWLALGLLVAGAALAPTAEAHHVDETDIGCYSDGDGHGCVILADLVDAGAHARCLAAGC